MKFRTPLPQNKMNTTMRASMFCSEFGTSHELFEPPQVLPGGVLPAAHVARDVPAAGCSAGGPDGSAEGAGDGEEGGVHEAGGEVGDRKAASVMHAEVHNFSAQIF